MKSLRHLEALDSKRQGVDSSISCLNELNAQASILLVSLNVRGNAEGAKSSNGMKTSPPCHHQLRGPGGEVHVAAKVAEQLEEVAIPF